MKRLQYSLLAAAGILVLAFVLTAVGPKRVIAALGYTPVRDVDQPARQPFAHRFNVTAFNSVGNGSDTFPVPDGKRLVIETIAVEGSVPTGQFFGLEFDATTAGQLMIYPVPTSYFGTISGRDNYNALHDVHIYADAKTVLTGYVGRFPRQALRPSPS